MDSYLKTRTSTMTDEGWPLPAGDRVLLKAPNGDLLAHCVTRAAAPAGKLPVERVLHGKANLLGYYFGRGGRAVTAEFGTFRLDGYLETSWAGAERRWAVRLRSPLEGLERESERR